MVEIIKSVVIGFLLMAIGLYIATSQPIGNFAFVIVVFGIGLIVAGVAYFLGVLRN